MTDTNTDTPRLEPNSDNTRIMLSLGKFAARREELGLTLSDVFARTRIITKNLAALEQKDFASLPSSPVYTRGFIRLYAKALNVDPEYALQEYDDYLKNIEDQVVAVEKSEADVIRNNKSSRVLFLSVILVFVFLGALVFLFNAQYVGDTEDQAANNLSSQEENAEMAAPAFELSEIIPPEPLKLMIRARETSWIAVRVDDQEKTHEAILSARNTVTFTGNRFSLNVGNAGGVDVFLQGKPLPSLGKKGEAVRINLPAENQ